MPSESPEHRLNHGDDPVAELLEQLSDLGDSDDPDVLRFGGEDTPVVASVDGELRYLSSGLILARRATEDDVRAAWDRRGAPDLVPLSTQSHRFDADDFRDVADLEGHGHV